MKKFLFIVNAVLFFLLSAHSASSQHIEVELDNPDDQITINVAQNKTFFVNSSVICRFILGCENVNGTVRYNSSSLIPDTAINETQNGLPFFINETPAVAMKQCPINPLSDGEECILNWTINSSGPQGSNWEIDVFFNSSQVGIFDNHTEDASVSITDCFSDFSVHWNSISFGLLNPNSVNNSAPGNTADEYNLTVNEGSCPTDLYIRGTDLENITLNKSISTGNITWSNISDDFADGAFRMLNTYSILKLNVEQNTNVTTWYWLDVPPIFEGIYNATIYITGVVNGEPPP